VNDVSATGRTRHRLQHWIEDRYLAADLRWLGIFRLLLGGLLCVDLLRRWGVARDFYSNDGILPNHFSLFRPLGRNVFSLLHAFSSPEQVNVAFALMLPVFVTFTLGYRTKLFHVLSLVCITSLNARNIMVENGGTVVVNLLCFWTLFLPLGKRFSIDALRSSLARGDASGVELSQRPSSEGAETPAQAAASNKTYALALFALLVQWSVIYFFNAVHKLPGEGWRDGSALHWFLHQDRIVTAFGIFAREHAPVWLLRCLTYATLVVEGVLAFILLVPFAQVWLRRVALVLALGLHGSIALTSRLGPFSYVMVLFFVLPLSSRDWDWLKAHFFRNKPERRVIYDRDCGLCVLICRVLLRLDLQHALRFVPNDDRSQIPESIPDALLEETVVVIDANGRQYVRERAVAEVLSALPFGGLLGVWLKLPVLSSIARAAYNAVALRRTEISAALGLARCDVPAAGGPAPAPAPREPERGWWPELSRHHTRMLREGLVLLAMFMMFNQVLTDNDFAQRNLRALRARVAGDDKRLQRLLTPSQPKPLLAVMDTLRLFQGWRMFSPEPPYEDGRLVVDGRTEDNRVVDPLTGERPDFDPYTPVGWGHDQFWCDYHLKMYFSQYTAYRPFLVDYLKAWHLRTGNPEDKLVAFDVWWVNDKSPPPGQLHGEPQPPVKIISFGQVKDSLAAQWQRQAAAK
jgi:predicted DCC family thiol-disulfide oxidoreductase YuxK